MKTYTALVLILTALTGAKVYGTAGVDTRVMGPAKQGGAYIISPQGGGRCLRRCQGHARPGDCRWRRGTGVRRTL